MLEMLQRPQLLLQLQLMEMKYEVDGDEAVEGADGGGEGVAEVEGVGVEAAGGGGVAEVGVAEGVAVEGVAVEGVKREGIHLLTMEVIK